jgi:hypothetical protein
LKGDTGLKDMASSDNERPRSNSGERGNDDERPRSNSGERDNERVNSRNDDNEELATRTIRIQSKRYYVDVKQNSRGRFIKLVEGLPNGSKNRISFPMAIVPDVRDKLGTFADYYKTLDPDSERDRPEDGRLKSDDIRAAQRKIYFDLKENKRGVFLRISSTASYGSSRQTIALPAQGINDIKECLSEFLEEFGQEEEAVELPEFKEMRIERKRFYFDCGSNDRGAFLRISEVTNRYRSSITIPKQGLEKFSGIIREIMDSMDVKQE